MVYKKHLGPRAEHRLRERERVEASPSIASRFPDVTSLAVSLAFNNREGSSNGSAIRYNVNLENAKAVFRFDCPNPECVGGDFDLSNELSSAVSQYQDTVNGEASCQGWASRHCIGTRRCEYRLHYQIELTYAGTEPSPSES